VGLIVDYEESRHVREQLSIDELTVFDILTRPGPNLAKTEREAVKKVARALLERLKGFLATNWRLTTQARAKVREAIEATLDADLPPPYTAQLFREKCARLFEHVYERHVA
jgi:type I restriction enzyme R subunit